VFNAFCSYPIAVTKNRQNRLLTLCRRNRKFDFICTLGDIVNGIF